MVVALIFVVLIVGAGALWARANPVQTSQFVSRAKGIVRGNGAATGAGNSAGAVKRLTPKALGEQIHRKVIGEATPLFNDSKHVRTQVWVYLPQALSDSFDANMLRTLGDQVASAIDETIAKKHWQASGPTAITWNVDSSLTGNVVRIDLLDGNATVMDPNRPMGGPGPVADSAKPSAPALELAGKSYDLPLNGEVTVGKDSSCTIVLGAHALKVSRRHLTLSLSNGSAVLRDHSSNWTKVNGAKVKTAELCNGDQILLPDGIAMTFRTAASRKVGL